MKNNFQDLVLYCDPAILIINKPAGLLVLPDGYNPNVPYLGGLLQPEFVQSHDLTQGIVSLP